MIEGKRMETQKADAILGRGWHLTRESMIREKEGRIGGQTLPFVGKSIRSRKTGVFFQGQNGWILSAKAI